MEVNDIDKEYKGMWHTGVDRKYHVSLHINKKRKSKDLACKLYKKIETETCFPVNFVRKSRIFKLLVFPPFTTLKIRV